MKRLAGAVAILCLCFARPAWAEPSTPADPDTDVDANLFVATASSEKSGEEIAKNVASAPSGTVYRFDIKCVSDEGEAVCNNPVTCDSPPGSVRYDVLISTDSGATFVKDSEACLTNPPDTEPQITPALVATEFKALAWPESPLQIQPPGGRTLVNLETNFFTTNTTPIVQPITLLEQQVEIEATPSSWTWHHGDGTSQTTQDAGAAYPKLDITHTYLRVAKALTPSVDTTYTGRYRVNGGPWIAIPATATVAGTPGQLEIVPATPQLVAAE